MEILDPSVDGIQLLLTQFDPLIYQKMRINFVRVPSGNIRRILAGADLLKIPELNALERYGSVSGYKVLENLLIKYSLILTAQERL